VYILQGSLAADLRRVVGFIRAAYLPKLKGKRVKVLYSR